MVIVDATGSIVLVNAQTEQVFGYPREELYHHSVDILLPEGFQALHRQHHADYFTNPQTRTMGAGSELYGRRKEGTEFPVEISLSPVQTEAGLFVIAAVRDITDRKTLQAQLVEANKLESLGRLAGGIAHDFNNLLMAILGYTELAQDVVASNSEAAQFLTNIQAAGERAATLTRQLLMYARRRMVAFQSVNLNVVIRGMEPMLRSTVGPQYDLTIVLTEPLWNVNTDVSQMEQVLLNLLINARDAMPDGGRIVVETANVVLDASYAETHPGVTIGEYAMLAVTDNGMGMTAEIQEHIFEPFFTTKEVGKGVGLGLATCYGIVKQSGGSIGVYSEIGKGTSFKVCLPRVLTPSIVPATPPPVELSKGSETILLVDDEPMVRDVAARALRAQGYQVLEAEDGIEALLQQAAYKDEIHVLVSDMVMPRMGGQELAALLREVRPGIRVLHMSGYTSTRVHPQGASEPDDALLTKPFTSVDLLQKVQELLKR